MTRPSLIAAAVLAVLLATGCGGKGAGKSNPAAPAVSMQGLRFHPAAIEVRVGQAITWTNADNVDHNVTAVSGASFKSRAFGSGKTFRYVAAKAGTIRYVCTLHPGMNGTITVK
jgi:plastocyanin